MANLSYLEIKDQVEQRLSSKRFSHTLSVEETAIKIFDSVKDALSPKDTKQIISSENFKEKLRLAAVLHDSCKELKSEEQLQLAEFYSIKIYLEDKDFPNLLHARVAAKWIEDQYGIIDPYIIKAVEEHTLAGVDMFLSSKIIFLADMIEPLRKSSDDLETLRSMIYQEARLDDALIYAIDRKISYQILEAKKIHPLAITARNSLL